MNEIQKSYEDGVLLYMKKSVRSLINILPTNHQGINLLLIPFLLLLYKKKIIRFSNIRSDKRWTFGELISYYKGADKETVTAVYSILYTRLEEIPYEAVDELIRVLDSFDQDFFFDNFHLIFEDYIQFLKLNIGKAADFPLLPEEIVQVFTGLVPVNMSSEVYNPYAGDYSLSIPYLGVKNLVSHEPGNNNWALGMIQYLAYDIEKLGEMKPQKPFRDFGNSSKKFDLILSASPFRLKFVDINRDTVTSIEEEIIRESVKLLKDNGKLVVWVPPSFLHSESKADTAVREFLVENDYLEKVISFPEGLLLPHTSLPFSILVIAKQKPKEELVQFVDAAETVKQVSKREKKIDVKEFFQLINSPYERSNLRFISNEDIANNYYKLNANRYLIKEEDELNAGYELVPLGDLVTVTSKVAKGSEPQVGRFIRIRDLGNNLTDYQLNLNNLEYVDIPNHAYRVDTASLLIALRFNKLKPTLVTNVHDPYYVTNDILALIVDTTKVDIRYLVSELNSSYFEAQIAKVRTGATIPYISKADLLQLKVRLTNLEEQKLRVNAELDILNRNNLSPFIQEDDNNTNTVAEQNVFLRHKLAGPAQTLGGTVRNLVELLETQVFLNYPLLKNLKLSDKHLYTLEDYLRTMMRESDSLIRVVGSQLRVDQEIASKKLVPVNVISFLEEYIQEVRLRPERGFEITYDFAFDQEMGVSAVDVYILANVELLKDLFNNFLENAVVHAFEGSGNNRFEISVLTNLLVTGDVEVQLLVSNTGKPLSETFTLKDFTRKGFSTGDKAGDGFGGWFINEIVKKFNGRLDYIDETSAEGLPETDLATSFEMSFPLYINA